MPLKILLQFQQAWLPHWAQQANAYRQQSKRNGFSQYNFSWILFLPPPVEVQPSLISIFRHCYKYSKIRTRKVRKCTLQMYFVTVVMVAMAEGGWDQRQGVYILRRWKFSPELKGSNSHPCVKTLSVFLHAHVSKSHYDAGTFTQICRIHGWVLLDETMHPLVLYI